MEIFQKFILRSVLRKQVYMNNILKFLAFEPQGAIFEEKTPFYNFGMTIDFVKWHNP